MASAKQAVNEFEAAARLMPGSQDLEMDARATRYLWFAGDEPGMLPPGGMRVSTPCIPNKIIYRGQVTPCVSTPVWSRKEEIPEGEMLAGSDQYAPGTGKAAYLLKAGPEANNLLWQYGHESDYTAQWGLVELKALRGKSLEEVAALRITSTFFPQYPRMPETNEEMAAHLESVREGLERGNDPNKAIYLACVNEMLTACEHAQAHQSRIAGESNMRVTLSPLDPGYKLSFDEKDKVYAKRAGIPLATNSQRGNQSDMIREIARNIQPQAPAIDPQAIAAIVAATVQALREPTPPVSAPVEEKKMQNAPNKKVA